jgi:hypothetical protein
MSAPTAPRVERIRHLLLTSSLVLAPILIAANGLMAMGTDFEDRAEVVAKAIEDPGRWQLQTLLGMLGFMLLVPAAIAAGQLVRRRRPTLALLSTMLIGASAIVIAGAILHEFTLAAATGVDVEAIAQYDTQVDELGGLVALIPLFFAGLVGMLLLAVGLWLSKATPLWIPILLALSIAVTFFLDPGVPAAIAETGLAVAFLGIAWCYLRAGPQIQEQVLVLPEAEAVSAPTVADAPAPKRDAAAPGGQDVAPGAESTRADETPTPPVV